MKETILNTEELKDFRHELLENRFDGFRFNTENTIIDILTAEESNVQFSINFDLADLKFKTLSAIKVKYHDGRVSEIEYPNEEYGLCFSTWGSFYGIELHTDDTKYDIDIECYLEDIIDDPYELLCDRDDVEINFMPRGAY